MPPMLFSQKCFALFLAFAAPAFAANPASTNFEALRIESEHLKTWPARYAARLTDIAEGRSIAESHRQLLQSLVRSDPQGVIQQALTLEAYDALPPEIRAAAETPISTVGDYIVLCALPAEGSNEPAQLQRFVKIHDREYPAVVYGKRMSESSKQNIPLNGVLIDGTFVWDEHPIQEVDATRLPAGTTIATAGTTTGIGVIGRVGGRYYRFANQTEFEATDAAIQTSEQTITPTPTHPFDLILGNPTIVAATGTNTWANGPKKAIVIRIDFSDLPGPPMDGNNAITADYAQNIMDSQIVPFYASVSYGKTSLVATVSSKVYRMSQPSTYYSTNGDYSSLMKEAKAAIQPDYPTGYDRYIVVFSRLRDKFSWAGLGQVSGTDIWINSSFTHRVVAHELGHSCGVHHANLWAPADGDTISPNGSHFEYGDWYDVMGGYGYGGQTADFNPQFKLVFGWLSPQQVRAVNEPGVYRIRRYDNVAPGPNDLVGLTYKKDKDHTYVVSYRGGFVSSVSISPATTIQDSAYVVWTQTADGVATELLDMTPATSNVYDAGLSAGSTFVDTNAGFQLRTIGTGGSSNDKYLDVEVTVADGKKFPTLTIADAYLGNPTVIAAPTVTPSLKTQLIVDGTVWQESAKTSPSFTWSPSAMGSHTIAVKTYFADGSTTSNTQTVTVGLRTDWSWISPQPQGLDNRSVVYAFDRWWMPADYGMLSTSTDGANWSIVSAPSKTLLRNMATDGTQLLLACSSFESYSSRFNSTLWTTTDGQTWGDITSGLGLSAAQFVYFLNNTWVVLGDNNKLVTSTDTVRWTTPVSLPASSRLYHYLDYANGRWAAVSESGVVAYSADLNTWTVAQLPVSPTSAEGLAANGDRWLLACTTLTNGTGTPRWFFTTDFATWTEGPSIDGTSPARAATAIGDRFVSATQNYIATTSDGSSWTKYNLPNASIAGVAERNGRFVAAGATGRSYTGSSIATLTATDNYPRLFIASVTTLADGTPLLATNAVSSTNNTNLGAMMQIRNGTLVSANGGSSSMQGVAKKNGTYVVVGVSGRISTSTDGSTWVTRASGFSQTLNAVAPGAAGFVAVGNGGAIITSPDGATWTTRTSTTTENLTGIAVDPSGNIVVAVGASGTVLLSNDAGATWVLQPTSGVGNISNVVWQSGLGFCYLSGVNLVRSLDGAAWTQTAATTTWTCLAATPIGLALGGSGMLGLTIDGQTFSKSFMPLTASRLFYANNALYACPSTSLISCPLQGYTPRPVAITSQPAAQSLPEGKAFALTVEITGDGPVTYQWYRSGVAIAGANSALYSLDVAHAADTGSYTVKITNALGSVTSDPATVIVGDGSIHVVTAPAAQAARLGASASFSVNATTTSGGGLTYQWYRNGQPIAGATSATLNINPVTLSTYGRYSVAISDGTVTLSSVANLAPPAAIQQASDTVSLPADATYAFTVQDVIPGVSYQWYANGVPISGATNPTLIGKTKTQGGIDRFTVEASINSASTTSLPVTVNTIAPDSWGHLVNVSVLTQSGLGDEALTVGFVTNDTKTVLLRGIGPTLSSTFNVAGALDDPQLELFNGTTSIATNDNWSGDQTLRNAFIATGAFGLDNNSKDAALLTSVSGLRTARVTGVGNRTGKALIEVYDTTAGSFTAATPRLINLSCRAVAGPGDQAVTAGFVIIGSTAKTVLIRATGPALAAFGLTGTLNDPKLTLYAGGNVIATNDNWGGIVPSSVFSSVGAFALSDSTSRDAALVITLPPGLYSAQMAPADNTSGIALIEVYEVP